MIEIEVETTYEQFLECNRLFCQKTTWSRRFGYFLMQYVYPAIGAIFAVLAVMMWTGQRRLGTNVVILMACAMLLLACRLSFARRVRKLYAKLGKNLIGTMRLTQEGLYFGRRNGTANANFTWKGLEGWIERPEMLMAIPGPTSFIRIPKDKLTPAEQEQVRNWLSENVKRID